MKRAFEMKQKTFFLASQVLSFRHAKQTGKNVPDANKAFMKPFEAPQKSVKIRI